MNDLFDIKICGINNEICMAAALDCKVEYVGLVFYKKSPRNVAIKTSSKLLKERNPITEKKLSTKLFGYSILFLFMVFALVLIDKII